MLPLSNMTVNELKKLLTELRSEFDELEEERTYVLSQTGLHISGKTVRQYETQLNDLRAEIKAVEQALRSRKRY